MINKLIWISALVLAMCLVSPSARADSHDFPLTVRQYGCALVVDRFGEREVRDVYYYLTLGGVVYWDAHFQVWIGPYGYWIPGGYIFLGYPDGYLLYYYPDYHPYSLHHRHGGHTCR